LQATDITGEGRHEVATSGYARSPRDVLRLVAFASTALLITLLTRFGSEGIVGFEDDLVELFAVLSPGIARVVSGAMQIFVALVGLVAFGIPIATRRWRVLGYLLLSQLIAGLAMLGLQQWLERSEAIVLNEVAVRAGIASDVFPDAHGLAQMAAAFVVLGPFVSRTWRRAGAASLVVVVLTNLLLSAQLPAHLFVALPLGAMFGAGVLVAFGRPHRRPTIDAVTAALTESALPVVDVRPAAVDARGSTPYFATTWEGPGVFAKVLGEDERAADLLFRLYRFLRMKNVGDDRPFSSLRRTVEHEALLSLYARDAGVRTPRMRTVLDVGDESMLLAYDMIDGKSLDAIEPDALTDEMMAAIWRQVAVLRQRRIAHRDLRLANVFAGADGEPSIIDFGFSELAAPHTLLDADVAQLLASLTVVAGPERAVATAIDVLGADAVGASLPRLQPMALSGATQTALKEQKGLLAELQAEVVARTGVEKVEYEQLSRVTTKTIFTVAMLAAVTYFLVPQFADLPGIVEQVKDANWAWFPAVVAVSAATYLFASVSLKGAVPDWLPYGPTFATQIGSSFASKLAPAGLGGMALNVRFLQKRGVDHAVAVSSVGLNSAAGFVGHIIMLGLFVVWAGRDAFGSIELPDPTYFLYGVGAVAVIAAGTMAIPVVRQQVVRRIFPIIGRSLSGVGAVVRRPIKLVQLIGGSALVTLSYLVCVYFSVEAFGGGLSLATVGAVYLAGSAVATAAPTPGGLGAVEAALIGGFVAAGLDNSVAVPAVFMFRLATFWLPILPGWLSFTWLQRSDYI
jgi:glycosyltransferase 2 family protein